MDWWSPYIDLAILPSWDSFCGWVKLMFSCSFHVFCDIYKWPQLVYMGVFFDLNVKYFPYSINFLLTLKVNFPHASKYYDLIMVENIYLMNSIFCCLRKKLYHNAFSHVCHNKIVLMSIIICHLLDVTRTLLSESSVPSK